MNMKMVFIRETVRLIPFAVGVLVPATSANPGNSTAESAGRWGAMFIFSHLKKLYQHLYS